MRTYHRRVFTFVEYQAPHKSRKRATWVARSINQWLDALDANTYEISLDKEVKPLTGRYHHTCYIVTATVYPPGTATTRERLKEY